MSDLFVEIDSTIAKNVNLDTLKADYCIDSSGSTQGVVLDFEKVSAKNLLYKQYGEKAGFLHTSRAKVVLIRFINRIKEFSSN